MLVDDNYSGVVYIGGQYKVAGEWARQNTKGKYTEEGTRHNPRAIHIRRADKLYVHEVYFLIIISAEGLPALIS